MLSFFFRYFPPRNLQTLHAGVSVFGPGRSHDIVFNSHKSVMLMNSRVTCSRRRGNYNNLSRLLHPRGGITIFISGLPAELPGLTKVPSLYIYSP